MGLILPKIIKSQNLFEQNKKDNFGTGQSGILSIPPSEFQTEKDKYYLKSNSKIILQGETKYWSTPGLNFTPRNTASDIIHYSVANGQVKMGQNDVELGAHVNLPNGSIVTAAVVYGSSAADDWVLRRVDSPTAINLVDLAAAAMNTEDTTITSATIDNSQYSYWLATGDIDLNDIVYGARITYTTPVESDELFINLNLPHNSTITDVIVYGNALATNDDFTIYKVNHSGTATNILGAAAQAIGTVRKDINEIIDNVNYSYIIQIDQTYGVGDGTWILYGAKVDYIN